MNVQPDTVANGMSITVGDFNVLINGFVSV